MRSAMLLSRWPHIGTMHRCVWALLAYLVHPNDGCHVTDATDPESRTSGKAWGLWRRVSLPNPREAEFRSRSIPTGTIWASMPCAIFHSRNHSSLQFQRLRPLSIPLHSIISNTTTNPNDKSTFCISATSSSGINRGTAIRKDVNILAHFLRQDFLNSGVEIRQRKQYGQPIVLG